MKTIRWSCRDHTSPVELCDALISEIRAFDVDVECIELYPLFKRVDTESILSEMSVDDLKAVVRMVLNYYK